MSLFTSIFGTKNDKDIKSLQPIVDLVNARESWAKSLKDEEFPQVTNNFKEEIANGKTLDEILPSAFALAREASFRVLGERHYDVQIMGAIVLHQGKILEMKTGEGKTLTCVPAAYLNALEGKGVHVVTVNDYLAERDAKWMGRVYNFLGLSVGTILSNMDYQRRKEAYSCDITYGTNNELGFDYLRDNMKVELSQKTQRGHHFCIVDEIDSILIDEARTPLIISGLADDDTQFARNAEKITPYFKECEKDPKTGDYPEISAFDRFDPNAKQEPEGDFMINEKQKHISFTKQGMIHMEELLQRMNIIHGSLYDDENFEYIHYVTQAMVARHLYKLDTDYVVNDDQVQIVDQFTGRILHGRRYSDGLHQAIEAKEHIKVQQRNVTVATVTFQNFFRMYTKLSGMTGTADTEAAEFNQIYNLDVVVVPTNVPVQRKDLDDFVFINEKFKLEAVCNEIEKIHSTGQPVLVGTVSIEKSELISSLLRKRGIKHEVLNAKNHAREAAIIENAGAVGAVTIATNMAGRGTDIKLGGSPEFFARKICSSEASAEELERAKEKTKPQWLEQYNKVKELGGLYIIGTERHESRRIDNQLRGRSGRQGDPGTSRFFVSFDDPLLRIFAGDTIRPLLARLGMNSGEPIEHSMVSSVIEKAQKRVEERNFDARKHLLDYDDLLNEQRVFIYGQRDSILADQDILERALNAGFDLVEQAADLAYEDKSEDKFNILLESVKDLTGFEYVTKEGDDKLSAKEIQKQIDDSMRESLEEKLKVCPKPIFADFIKKSYLYLIDSNWQNHLAELEDLREAVGLRSYAQRDPLVEYKIEGSDIFDEMINRIKINLVKKLNKVQFRVEGPARSTRERQFKETHNSFALTNLMQGQSKQMADKVQNKGQTSSIQVIRSTPKVGRNDPCPCGSGKKYKNCHGRNQNV